jgi:hypothetical protein
VNPNECISLDAYSTYVSDWHYSKRRRERKSLWTWTCGDVDDWTLTSCGRQVTRMLTWRTATGALAIRLSRVLQGALCSETQNVQVHCIVRVGIITTHQHPPEVLPGLISSHPSFPHLQPAILAPPRGKTISEIMEPQPSFSLVRPWPSQVRNLTTQESAISNDKNKPKYSFSRALKSKTCMRISNT